MSTKLTETTSIVLRHSSRICNLKMTKEDEAVIISNNGENGFSAAQPVPAEMLEVDKKNPGDLKHPTIPGWFSEYCPIWPGRLHFQ